MNTTPHINRAKVKQTALDLASKKDGPCYRAQGFTRVGAQFFEKIEAAVRRAIVEHIKSQPSKGKTLQ